MKKKIALMIFSGVISGAESVVIRMLDSIDKEKFEVYLITNDEIVDKIQIENIIKFSVGKKYQNTFIERVKKKILGVEKYSKYKFRNSITRVNNYIVAKNIELVHSNLLNDHYVNACLPNKNIFKVMTIHGAHGLDGVMAKSFSVDSIKKIYGEADLVCSACDYFIELLKNIGVQLNYKIVPNGIDFNLIDEKYTPEIKDDNLNIVYLGGTRDVKGWDILLGALDIVVNEKHRENIHLNILRDVPKDSKLYQYAETHGLLKYITFSGYVSNNDHLKHMSACNLYTLPSYSEGIANTLTEAIGYCKPILATDVGGTSELVKHMENGYLCETNARSIAEGILFFLDNQEKIQEFGQRNKRIGESMSWSDIIKLYEQEYLKLLDH